MKILTILLLALLSLQAKNFTKQNLYGTWELSSAKLNKTVVFLKYIGKDRNEAVELIFNPQGKMKISKSDDIYNYEFVGGKLKFYKTKVYGNNYKVKQTRSYDLYKVVGNIDGCKLLRLEKKKMPGYSPKRDLMMCKILNYPKPTYQESISKYRF